MMMQASARPSSFHRPSAAGHIDILSKKMDLLGEEFPMMLHKRRNLSPLSKNRRFSTRGLHQRCYRRRNTTTSNADRRRSLMGPYQEPNVEPQESHSKPTNESHSKIHPKLCKSILSPPIVDDFRSTPQAFHHDQQMVVMAKKDTLCVSPDVGQRHRWAKTENATKIAFGILLPPLPSAEEEKVGSPTSIFEFGVGLTEQPDGNKITKNDLQEEPFRVNRTRFHKKEYTIQCSNQAPPSHRVRRARRCSIPEHQLLQEAQVAFGTKYFSPQPMRQPRFSDDVERFSLQHQTSSLNVLASSSRYNPKWPQGKDSGKIARTPTQQRKRFLGRRRAKTTAAPLPSHQESEENSGESFHPSTPVVSPTLKPKPSAGLDSAKPHELPFLPNMYPSDVLINFARRKYNLAPFHRSMSLSKRATAIAQQIARGDCEIEEMDDERMAVNVLYGVSAQAIHAQTMSKEAGTTRATIFNPKYSQMGVGTAKSADGNLCMCQLFRASTE